LSHARDFGSESGNPALAEQLVYDYREADLPKNQRAFCDYAVRLTLSPGDVTAQDVQQLRDAGYDDQQISLGTQVISYFNYINRVADGLGVDPEEWMQGTAEEWQARKAKFV